MNKNGKSGDPCIFFSFRGETLSLFFFFNPLNMLADFLDALYEVEQVSLYL